MGDPGDEHEALGVVDRVHDPVVAHPDAKVVAAGELHGAVRTRLCREAVDRALDPVTYASPEPTKRPHSFGMEPDLVHSGLGATLADLAPLHSGVALIAGLQRREAVLEVVEPLDELGVALRVEDDGGETPSLRDVERVLRFAKRVQLSSQAPAQVFCSDNSGHAAPSVRLTVQFTAMLSVPTVRPSTDEAIRLADAGENDAAMQLLSTASTELRRSGLTEEAEALELEQPLLTPHRYADAAARKQLHYESHRRKRGR